VGFETKAFARNRHDSMALGADEPLLLRTSISIAKKPGPVAIEDGKELRVKVALALP
jgi:hypothetical protein